MAKKQKNKIIKLKSQEEFEDFLSIVRDDILFLKEHWTEQPTRTTARIFSALLRRLLVDQMLMSAWALLRLEGEPILEAPDLTATMAPVDPKYIQFAYGGGAPTRPAHHTCQAAFVVPVEEMENITAEDRVRELFGEMSLVERKYLLSEFLASASVVSGCAQVSRLGVVRYVANKAGGVHWDNERRAWSHPIGSRHRLLDENHLKIGVLNAAEYEVISIAYALIKSPSLPMLFDAIQAAVPQSEPNHAVLQFREGRTGKYVDMTFGGKPELL